MFRGLEKRWHKHIISDGDVEGDDNNDVDKQNSFQEMKIPIISLTHLGYAKLVTYSLIYSQ